MVHPSIEPWSFRETDIFPGENPEKVGAALARFELEEVRTDEAFEFGYRALDAQFGPINEIERRDVLQEWFQNKSLTPAEQRVRAFYHMSLVWEGRTLAAVRDDFGVVDRQTGHLVAFLSHSLVLPAYRRSGVAALLRALPAVHARNDAVALGVEPTEVSLLAEMDMFEPQRHESLVRLYSYGKAGFRVVPPWHVPYAQPDFRDVLTLGIEVQPVPMMLLVRQVGEESRTTIEPRRARTLLDALAAIHHVTVDAEQIHAMHRNVSYRLDPKGGPIPLLDPAPIGQTSVSLEPLARAKLTHLYPMKWLGEEVQADVFPGEPLRALMKTSVPGPRSEEIRARHQRYQDARTVHYYQDARRSMGNYAVDVDGNTLLDVSCHLASVPIGYNHPALVEAFKRDRFAWALGFRPALGVAPPPEWVDLVEGLFMRYAPAGHDHVMTVTSGTEAVENALKAAFAWKARRRRAGRSCSHEEIEAAMRNRQPGIDELKIISFAGSFHGRTLGALSATRSKPVHKLDFPAFDWPEVPFPTNLFPLDAHVEENRAAEARSLEVIEHVLRDAGGTIAGLIVEPIQAEGDRHASAAFFRSLRWLLTNYEAAFIVDEIQTGLGATGTFWAHDKWHLDTPPDIVTWSKKFQLGGLHLRAEFWPLEPYRLFHTFLGDPLRAAQAEVILEVVEKDDLVNHTRKTGEVLVSGLSGLCRSYPDIFSQARGTGTFAAVDVCDAATRDRVLHRLRQIGLEAGGSGERSIRFRPALVFGARHVGEALELLDTVAKNPG